MNSAREESSRKGKNSLANELNVEVFDEAFSNDDASNDFIFNDGENSPKYTPKKPNFS